MSESESDVAGGVSEKRPGGLQSLVELWFGVRRPVGRLAYAASGFGLMLFKYAVEAWLIWLFTGQVFW